MSSLNPYQAPLSSDRSSDLPVIDERAWHWTGNTIALYLIGFTYFFLLQCACPVVHLGQIPGVVVPLAWSGFVILNARTFGEGIVAGVNGILVGGLTLLFLVPFVMRFGIL